MSNYSNSKNFNKQQKNQQMIQKQFLQQIIQQKQFLKYQMYILQQNFEYQQMLIQQQMSFQQQQILFQQQQIMNTEYLKSPPPPKKTLNCRISEKWSRKKNCRFVYKSFSGAKKYNNLVYQDNYYLESDNFEGGHIHLIRSNELTFTVLKKKSKTGLKDHTTIIDMEQYIFIKGIDNIDNINIIINSLHKDAKNFVKYGYYLSEFGNKIF